MSQIRTETLILKSMKWKDTSEIISLFTRESGRLDVIAKGSRSHKSQYRGVLESLNQLEAFIYISPSRTLQKLGSVTLLNSYSKIRQDLDRLVSAMAMLELVLIFFKEGEEDPVFYDFLVRLLDQMNESTNHKIILIYFLLKLCSYLGFKPNFDQCKICSTEIVSDIVHFQFERGGLICERCGLKEGNLYTLSNYDSNMLKSLQNYNHREISKLKFTRPFNKNLMRFLLDFLRFHTGEKIELTSITFFETS